jgi:taurine-pyruvate aminotransferase
LDTERVNQVIAYCKQEGILIGKNGATVAGFNNVLTLAPPLNIEHKDLQFITKTLTEALGKLE